MALLDDSGQPASEPAGIERESAAALGPHGHGGGLDDSVVDVDSVGAP